MSKSIIQISLVISLVTLLACANMGRRGDRSPASANPGHGPAHWSYHGEEGPAHWGDLSSDNSVCKTGHEQSPVDLRWKKPFSSRTIDFHYAASPLKIIDNGHTVQANFGQSGYAVIDGKKYDLLQMHFHETSEHTLSGKHFPMELHLVHKSDDGKLAVVGVMIKESKNHRYENTEVEKLWKNFPTEKNLEKSVSSVTIDPNKFLPSRLTHYHYMGSLTTPPCSEGVNWNVMNTPIEVSSAQLATFQRTYVHTNRPVQPWGNRSPANFK